MKLPRNKVICGDCRKILTDLPNNSVSLVLTDPPYGVLPNGKTMDDGETDDFDWDNIENLVEFTEQWYPLACKKLRSDSFFFTFWSQKHLNEGIEIFDPDRVIFWRYNNLINNPKNDFAYDYEPIFVIRKGNPKMTEGKHSCDLEYTKPQSNFDGQNKLVHPAQKPLGLVEHIINIVEDIDLVLDPFLGSGTTAVACERFGIDWIGIEKSKKYVKMARQRIQKIRSQQDLGKYC